MLGNTVCKMSVAITKCCVYYLLGVHVSDYHVMHRQSAPSVKVTNWVAHPFRLFCDLL